MGFSSGALVNLALMDQVVSVDKERRQVVVQAGARVSQVTDALRPHGLVLQNFASIAEHAGMTEPHSCAYPRIRYRVFSLQNNRATIEQ